MFCAFLLRNSQWYSIRDSTRCTCSANSPTVDTLACKPNTTAVGRSFLWRIRTLNAFVRRHSILILHRTVNVTLFRLHAQVYRRFCCISDFIVVCFFLGSYKKENTNPATKILQPWKTVFSHHKKLYIATLNEKLKFHYTMSMVSNIIFANAGIYWCFTRNTVSCYTKRFV